MHVYPHISTYVHKHTYTQTKKTTNMASFRSYKKGKLCLYGICSVVFSTTCFPDQGFSPYQTD